jgi:hypothetical protein
VGGVVVDWEREGKAERQAGSEARIGTDTQINTQGPQDLSAVVAASSVPTLCRLDRWSESSPAELDVAAACGAAEVLLPMVRTTGEVEAALDAAAGRVGVGILVETQAAVEIAKALADLPVTRVYVGLMDLALDRGSASIFDAVADGTVEQVRSAFDVPFGFAGLTVPGSGRPVPVSLLAGEMTRLGCAFSFLRRSFIRDAGDSPRAGLRSIIEMLRDLEARSAQEVDSDHAELLDLLHRQRTDLETTWVGSP